MSRFSVEIVKEKRKTISVGITPDGNVIVKAPIYTKEKYINDFLDEKESWIIKNVERNKRRQKKLKDIEILSKKEIEELYESARDIIPLRCGLYSKIIGVDYHNITIRSQKTRWGSCSSRGNLNFNIALMLVPKEILDYVIVHELCHRKEMNHSDAFWNEVCKILPDYKERRKWLKNNGDEAMVKLGII